jgi:hypothetical protein
MARRGPKPKFIDVPCPNEDCTLYGVTGEGNVIGNGTYITQSGKVQKFCGRTNTVFYDLRTEEDKILVALKMILKGMSLWGVVHWSSVKDSHLHEYEINPGCRC